MPRATKRYRWADRAAFRGGVLEECHRRFLALFGEPCTAAWLDGWRKLISYLVAQDTKARELRHDGSVELAARFLREQGASPDGPATGVVTAHTLQLAAEVRDALADGRRRLLPVGALPRELPKLKSSHLEVIVLLFETHSDRDGRSRWLTNLELAVISLLITPERISVDTRALQKRGKEQLAAKTITTAPSTAIDAEARKIKRARKESGDLRTVDDERWELGTASSRPLLKPVLDVGLRAPQQSGPARDSP